MKLVTWTDEDGFNHQSLLRSDDPDEMAIYGIPLDPPDLAECSIPEEVRKGLHNELLSRGLISWADVMAQQDGVTATVQKVARRHNLKSDETRSLRRCVLALYRR
jgi:hypothetical protein